MAAASSETRLVELESQVAQNQDTIDELNDQVRKLWDQLEQVKAEVKVLGREILAETEGEATPHMKTGR